jgi:hypothetical protein
MDPLEEDILELENDLASLGSEVDVLKNHLRSLDLQESLAKKEENERIDNELEARENFNKIILYYTAPISGLVGWIEKQPNEVCYQGENVLTVHQLENIRIKAFFDPKYGNSVKIGDEVIVRFENGTNSRGIIENFYASTYPLPPEFQKKYESVTRALVADVVPLNEEEARNWSVYYKMSVKVIKKRLKWLL